MDAARLDFFVYFHEWLPPFGWRYLVVPAAVMLFAWFAFWPPYFRNNIPYRSTRTAITVIERIDLLRPGPKEGFAMQRAFVFRVEDQDVEYPVSFTAAPGDYVAVQYIVDFRGHVLISNVALAKNPS